MKQTSRHAETETHVDKGASSNKLLRRSHEEAKKNNNIWLVDQQLQLGGAATLVVSESNE